MLFSLVSTKAQLTSAKLFAIRSRESADRMVLIVSLVKFVTICSGLTPLTLGSVTVGFQVVALLIPLPVQMHQQ